MLSMPMSVAAAMPSHSNCRCTSDNGGERSSCEGDASAGAQHAMRFAEGARDIGDMEQGFLADDGILLASGSGRSITFAFEHPHLTVQANAPCQLGGAGDARRSHLDAGNNSTKGCAR